MWQASILSLWSQTPPWKQAQTGLLEYCDSLVLVQLTANQPPSIWEWPSRREGCLWLDRWVSPQEMSWARSDPQNCQTGSQTRAIVEATRFWEWLVTQWCLMTGPSLEEAWSKWGGKTSIEKKYRLLYVYWGSWWSTGLACNLALVPNTKNHQWQWWYHLNTYYVLSIFSESLCTFYDAGIAVYPLF